MVADSNEKSLQNILVCPHCRYTLEFLQNSVLCSRCKREYGIEDNIFIMIDENSIRDEIKKANIEYFRIKSKTYDNLFEEDQIEINRKVEEKIQRYTDSLKKGVCLDVGTGT